MNVKVNRVRGGSMGDQRNYGLVTGSIWNYEDKPSTNEVSDTLGAVDRDQATIEAERGETVIYPDKDGQITHAKIGGKRHTHGGTPLDIPDGAFVFSDTRALLIKNKELLKNIFGMNSKKAVTPAKVAQRYDLNQYNEILNDPESDFLSKKTAQLMLDNNMKKLGQLALVQEGMKGFPDGIPDIALPLFGSDIAVAQPMQEMPQAKFGGQIMRRGGKKLPRHQYYGAVDEEKYSAEEQERLAKYYGKLGRRFGLGPVDTQAGEYDTAKRILDDFLYDIPGTPHNSYAYDKHLIDLYNQAVQLPQATANPYYDPTNIGGGPFTYYNEYFPSVNAIEGMLTLPGEGSVKRASVQKANELFRKAYAAGIKFDADGNIDYQNSDPAVLRAASLDVLEGEKNQAGERTGGIDVPRSASTGVGSALSKAADWASQFGHKLYSKGYLRNLIQPFSTDGPRVATDAPDMGQYSDLSLFGDIGAGNWSWQSKVENLGNYLSEAADAIEASRKVNKGIGDYKQVKADFNKDYDLVVDKANEVLKNPTAYTNQQIKAAQEMLGIKSFSLTNSGDIVPYNKFWEELRGAKNINEMPEWFFTKKSGPIDQLANVKNILLPSAEQQRQEQENAGTQSNKESLNQWISGIKSGKYSVNEVSRDLLPDLEAAGIDISGAGNPAPTRSSSSSRSTQQRATTAPSKTEESDETIRQRLISIGIDPNDITPEMIQQNKYAKGGMTYVYDPTNNIMLDKYQTKGGVKAFNIYDKNFRDYANQNKLKLVLPSWATGMMSIGEQNPSKDPRFKKSATGEIIPSAGISGYTGPDDLIKWHKSQGMDFSKYVDADGNTAKDETDGMTKFKNDLKTWDNSGKKHRHATSWMLGKVDEINTERATKLGLAAPPSQTDKGVTGWDVTGFDVLTGTKYLAPEDTPPDDVPPAEKPPGEIPPSTPPGKVPTPQYTAGYPGGWTDYSTLNLATAMGMANQVEPGALPPFTQAFPDLGRPVFMDPRANIMNQLALQNQQAEMIAGMSSPTVGRANIIASAAKTAEPISDIMAKYDQANATIANTYEGQRAAISNQAQMTNAAKREEFQDELAVRRQNYLNALKESQANVAYQYERGAKDFREKNALNVQNPNYMFDNYGNIMFKPGYNPNATASSSADDLLDNYINKGIDPNKAAALVAAQMKLNDNAFNYDPMSTVWGSQKPVS